MQEIIYLLYAIGVIILLCMVKYIYNNTNSRDNSKNNYSVIGGIMEMNENTKENFIANSNLTNQAPMNFNYLKNPNYTRDILATYYLDDDKKINGQRAVFHPYMYSYDNNYGRYWWLPPISNHIYKSSGVRV